MATEVLSPHAGVARCCSDGAIGLRTCTAPRHERSSGSTRRSRSYIAQQHDKAPGEACNETNAVRTLPLIAEAPCPPMSQLGWPRSAVSVDEMMSRRDVDGVTTLPTKMSSTATHGACTSPATAQNDSRRGTSARDDDVDFLQRENPVADAVADVSDIDGEVVIEKAECIRIETLDEGDIRSDGASKSITDDTVSKDPTEKPEAHAAPAVSNELEMVAAAVAERTAVTHEQLIEFVHTHVHVAADVFNELLASYRAGEIDGAQLRQEGFARLSELDTAMRADLAARYVHASANARALTQAETTMRLRMLLVRTLQARGEGGNDSVSTVCSAAVAL